MNARDSTAGLTLVEMLVALVLFALVGLASFTTLDAIIRTRDRTEGRLEQIARYDRALILFSRDVMQATPAGIASLDGTLVLPRQASRELVWGAGDSQLQRRSTAGGMAQHVTQAVLDDVETVQFRYLDSASDWHDDWTVIGNGEPSLRAVEMTLELSGSAGTLVRLAEVAQPVPVGALPNALSGALGGPAGDTEVPADDTPAEGN